MVVKPMTPADHQAAEEALVVQTHKQFPGPENAQFRLQLQALRAQDTLDG
jgi:hypothetical protein